MIKGPEIIDEMVLEASIDRILMEEPKYGLVDADRLELIKLFRAERAMFEIKETKAKAKKEGVEDDIAE